MLPREEVLRFYLRRRKICPWFSVSHTRGWEWRRLQIISLGV